MAAGTEIAQPVSALDGAYKPLPLDDGNLKENGAVVDNKNSSPTEKDVVVDMDKSGRPPRPQTTSISASTTVSIRGCVTHALISSVAPASGLVWSMYSSSLSCSPLNLWMKDKAPLYTCVLLVQGYSCLFWHF
jgi:hypothetical protein